MVWCGVVAGMLALVAERLWATYDRGAQVPFLPPPPL